LTSEHDLYDQLQLLQTLAFVGDVHESRVELLEVREFEGQPDFHGLGELTAADLESLWGKRRPVETELVALARLGWDAVRAPEPTAVTALLERGTAALPFLDGALRRLLEELPDTESGLSRGERQVLESLAAGPLAPGQLFLESQSREEAPFEGDAWFWRRLSELGSGERPLLVCAASGIVGPPPPLSDARTFASAQLVLTDDGRAVLAGEADRVELLGRPLGGRDAPGAGPRLAARPGDRPDQLRMSRGARGRLCSRICVGLLRAGDPPIRGRPCPRRRRASARS
jgi:hypothetical protein